MSEPRRRRRSGDEPPRGLPLFPLIVLVILAGLLLGGVLAHFFGQTNRRATPIAANESPAPTPSYAVPLASPTATPASSPTVSPTASPTQRATAAPTSATPHPTPSQSPAPSPSPASKTTPAPKATPTLAVSPTPSSRPPPQASPSASAAVAVPPPSGSTAVGVVRSYLSALARGDRATAASYLAHGAPSESYMNSNARIESMRVAPAGARQYQVTAAVESGGAEYYATFTLGPGPNGLVITDHYTIKPQ